MSWEKIGTKNSSLLYFLLCCFVKEVSSKDFGFDRMVDIAWVRLPRTAVERPFSDSDTSSTKAQRPVLVRDVCQCNVLSRLAC